MQQPLVNAFSEERDVQKVTDHLIQQLGDITPAAIFFFTYSRHDGALISKLLHQRYAGAEVLGCTTAGAFTEKNEAIKGISALAMGQPVIKRCSAALARFDGGVEQGIQAAAHTISTAMNIDLRNLDAKHFVGVALLEGLKMNEEDVNEALGNIAPAISFVGGSAADNLKLNETRVFYNGEESNNGAALLLIETDTPFVILKTCSARTTGKKFTITRADEAKRTVYEFDGEPVLKKYAQAVGLSSVDEINFLVFANYPMGLMIDGEPWIRTPQQTLPDDGLKFWCRINEGIEVDLLQATDLVENLKNSLTKTRQELGGSLSGGLVFNCVLRRLEMDLKNLHEPFLKCFSGLTIAGFHTYGETYLGHMNQTSTALLFK
jgi:hypothetical protein